MMRWKIGAMAVGVALVACSGRYEVGSMDTGATAGSSSVAGSSSFSVAGSASGYPPMMVAMALGGSAAGGTSSAGPSGIAGDPTDASCADLGAPAAIAGPFAAPAVVWNRIAMLTYGTIVVKLSPLPSATTYAWAGQTAEDATTKSGRAVGGAGGVDLVLTKWLGLPPTAMFLGAWSQFVPSDVPVLEVLLQTPMMEPNHHGIFGEPAWLTQYSEISARGSAVSAAVFGAWIPTEPKGLMKATPDPSLTDRQALDYTLGGSALCLPCHQLMDPLGYTFGHFDSAGQYRETDQGQAIDAVGVAKLPAEGRSVTFDGPKEFGLKVGDTCDAALGFADGFLRAAMALNQQQGGLPGDAAFEANSPRIRQAFIHGGRTYSALVKAYAQSPLGLRP